MFQDALKELRLQLGWTQETLAQKAGLSKSTISMYENGKRNPDYEQLELFADIFNVDMNRLIGKPAMQEASAHFTAPADPRLVKVSNVFHQINERGKQYLYETAIMCAGNPQYQADTNLVPAHEASPNNEKARPLKEQAGDAIVRIPVAARSGEQATIVTTKEKLDCALASLVPKDDLDL